MILNFDNIGGILCIPAGAAARVLYGYAPSGRKVYTRSRRAYISVDVDGYSPHRTGLLVPNPPTPTRPVLDIRGRCYLSGAKILADANEVFVDGGYLGTVNAQWRFRVYEDESRQTLVSDETVTIPVLGVIPGAYSGGLRVDGLTMPAASMRNIDLGGAPPERVSDSTPCRANGLPIGCINYLARSIVLSADPRLVIDWLIPAVIGTDFRWEFQYSPFRSRTP